MAVTIRMKRMGKKHRHFFRICACDVHSPRDGRVLEELGTYDPMIKDTDARVVLKNDRVSHWLSVGALPSERVKTLLKKYGTNGKFLAQNVEARAKLSLPKVVPPAPTPVEIPVKKTEEEAAAEASAETESAG